MNLSEPGPAALGVVLLFLVGSLSRAAQPRATADKPVTLTPSELKCEYAVNPLGLDVSQPRFSWVLKSSRRGQMQSAYRVLVASTERQLVPGFGDMWDSGKVESDQSLHVAYQGKAPAGGAKCWWKVCVWDKQGKPSPWSKPATFEMGLLNKSDWQAKWIGIAAGSSVNYVKGKLGQAVVLDGTSQTIKIPHYDKLKPSAEITISAWIKPTECTDSWREIYRKEDGEARHLLAIGKTSGVFGLWCGLGIDGKYVERGAALAASGLTDGEWHCLAATYDGSSITFYADGKQIGKAAVKGPMDTAGSSPAYIGSSGGSGEFFPGGIDDVRIYDRALSADEIKALAGATAKAAKRSLVGWWKLDGSLANSAGGKDGEAAGVAPPEAPLLRKTFEMAKKVKRARVYLSGLGWYELYINGRKVGDHVLDPATTDYQKRVLYVTYDITDRLQKGPNAVGVMLGNGWYCEPGRLKYGKAPQLLMQMHVEFADGSTTVVKTDPTWKATTGPIVRNDIWGGETYDARLDKPGWATAGYDDGGWGRVEIRKAPGGKLQSQVMPAIKVNRTIEPVKFTNPKPGVYVYDMGQLFGGWARLRVKGPKGTKVTIKYAARMFKGSGLVDKRRHRGTGETDFYILKGDPEGEVYEPRFTYHPVRYVQIEGYPGKPARDALDGRAVYSAVDMSGDFECSDPVLNRIHRNVVWTLTNGLFGIPLDCLHREHWAWTDPATITGSLYTRKHTPLFWTKWLYDIADAQYPNGAVPDVAPSYNFNRSDPAWGGNYPILVWYLHEYYGDRRIVEQHYAGMKKWIDYLTSIADDHLVTKGHYGDHMLPGKSPGKEEFISSETPRPLVWTGYYYRGALVLSKAARLLGKRADADRYDRLAEEIKTAFNAKWLNKETNQYATGSQTANLFPLALEIVPEANRPGLLDNIVRDISVKRGGHLHTGNTGTTCMIDTLADCGHGNVMYRAATIPTYPGWGYMAKQGATTIWEAWGLGNGAESMIMWATIDEFFYNDLAGIRGPEYYGPEDTAPGFRRIHIRPRVLGVLKYARASIKTVRGVVSSGWKKEGKSLVLEVILPANSQAKVSVPKIGLQNVTVTEGGKVVWKDGSYVSGVAGITGAAQDADHVTFDVGSGEYCFTLRK